ATPVGRGAARGASMRRLTLYGADAVIVIERGRFLFVGPRSEMPREIVVDDDVDARGATAIPGFVDSHTHIAFAGTRESEFNRRLQGETYEEIAASGGGIASTVHATRRAPEEQLVDEIVGHARLMALHGTTTAEVKSGYGLDKECELKQLRAIRTANDRSPARLVPTCLAAHEFPPERRGSAAARQGHVSAIGSERLPGA